MAGLLGDTRQGVTKMSSSAKPPAGSGKPGAPRKTAGPAPTGGIEIPADLLSEFGLTVWEADIDPDMEPTERRGFQRVNRGVFLDEDIAVYTNNLTQGVASRDMLLDISASGLLLISDREKLLGDILLLEFRMGMEKFKVKGEVKRKKDRTYGIQFIDPPPAMVENVERIYGSVRLNKAFRGQHRVAK